MLELLHEIKYDNDLSNFIFVSGRGFFCRECHQLISYDVYDPPAIECENKTVFEIPCPHCGYTNYAKQTDRYMYSNNKSTRKKNEKKFANIKLYEIERISNPYGQKTSECVFVDRDAGKLFIFIRYINVISTNNGLMFEPYYDKHIFNYNTHMSYVVRNKTFKGKQAYGSTDRSLINKTYEHYAQQSYLSKVCNMSHEILEEAIRHYFAITGMPFADEIIQGIKTKDHYSITKHLYAVLRTANRFPNMLFHFDHYKQEYALKPAYDHAYLNERFMSDFPKTITDYQSWVKDIVDRYKLPKSKTFRKMYLESPKLIDKTIYLTRCGFKNIDNLQKMLKADLIFDNYCEFYTSCPAERKKTIRSLRRILSKMNKASTEASVCNKLLRGDNTWLIMDMCHMENSIYTTNASFLKHVNWCGSFKEIHDDLAMLETKIAHVNKEISYSERERAIEKQIDGFAFKLAKDTNELVAIGQELKICVGSYRDRALCKQSTIVSVTRDDTYVGCIEINRDFHLIQVKGKRNTYLKDEVGNAAKSWVHKVGLKGQNKCHDFIHIGESIISTHDYHQLELNDRGEVVEANRANNHHANDYFYDDEFLPF